MVGIQGTYKKRKGEKGMEKQIYVIIDKEFEKARVKGFLRTRKGKLERIKEHQRKGEKKEKAVKVRVGMIAGGRAGEAYKTFTLDFPTHLVGEKLYDFLDEKNILPNDVEKGPMEIVRKIKSGKSWIGDDVYGEGVLGIAPSTVSKEQLKNLVIKKFGRW